MSRALRASDAGRGAGKGLTRYLQSLIEQVRNQKHPLVGLVNKSSPPCFPPPILHLAALWPMHMSSGPLPFIPALAFLLPLLPSPFRPSPHEICSTAIAFLGLCSPLSLPPPLNLARSSSRSIPSPPHTPAGDLLHRHRLPGLEPFHVDRQHPAAEGGGGSSTHQFLRKGTLATPPPSPELTQDSPQDSAGCLFCWNQAVGDREAGRVNPRS
jgi:hypothetical protein